MQSAPALELTRTSSAKPVNIGFVIAAPESKNEKMKGCCPHGHIADARDRIKVHPVATGADFRSAIKKCKSRKASAVGEPHSKTP